MNEYELSEYNKCKNSIEYFFYTYYKFYQFYKGLSLPEVNNAQNFMFLNSRRSNMFNTSRQLGSTTYACVSLLHNIIFNNNTVTVLVSRMKFCKEILSRIKEAYNSLPEFLRLPVKKWNIYDIVLDNNSSINITSDLRNLRGLSIDLLVFDDYEISKEEIKVFLPTLCNPKGKTIIINSGCHFTHLYKKWNINTIDIPYYIKDQNFKNLEYLMEDTEYSEKEFLCKYE